MAQVDACVLLESVLARPNIERDELFNFGRTAVVTASFGVAGFQGRNLLPFAELLRHADEALYEAKRNGRNRVEFALDSADPLEHVYEVNSIADLRIFCRNYRIRRDFLIIAREYQCQPSSDLRTQRQYRRAEQTDSPSPESAPHSVLERRPKPSAKAAGRH